MGKVGSSGTGCSGGAASATPEAESLQGLIEKLPGGIDALRVQDPIQKEMLKYREALAGAVDAERKQVEALIIAREKVALAVEGMKASKEFFEQTGVNALDALVTKGESLQDVLKGVAATFLKAAVQGALFGQGPFGTLFHHDRRLGVFLGAEPSVMRTYETPTANYLAARAGTVIRILIWAEAKNRSTGLTEALGLWTGAEDRAFTIEGGSRNYVGAGTVMQVPPITYGTGLAVRMQRLILSPLAPAVGDLIRTYDCRFAPLQIHRALFSTDDSALIAEPHRVFKGFIDEAEFIIPESGGEARCEVTVASSARLLTRTLALKYSDATQQLRSGDRFFKYAEVSGSVDVYWGKRRSAPRRDSRGRFAKKPDINGGFGR